jgi:exodeoxyribonuclease VII small subunit
MNKKITFEEAMTSLEDAVRALESGSLTLDQSLKTFEDAVSLIKLCNEKLSSAEQKVKILIEGVDGTVTDAPFGTENEA